VIVIHSLFISLFYLMQRTIRLAINAINSSIDAWKVCFRQLFNIALQCPPPPTATPKKKQKKLDFYFPKWQIAIDDGKKHATNLTNSILTSG
jgi:hypothetical protein